MKTLRIPLLLGSVLFMASCSLVPPDTQNIEEKKATIDSYEGEKAQALFAGGCFWCIESAYEHVDGVITAISGFAGGNVKDPSYKEVSSGITKHLESVLVIYDPTKVTYSQLVEYFWKQYDPTDATGSFGDRGHQYTSAIFYETEEQRKIAEASKAAIDASGTFENPVITPIIPIDADTEFFPAEEYHQDYYKKNPIRYGYYRRGSGRDDFLRKIWNDETWKGL